MPGAPGVDRAGAQGLRFLVSGAANTALTYALYLASHRWAGLSETQRLPPLTPAQEQVLRIMTVEYDAAADVDSPESAGIRDFDDLAGLFNDPCEHNCKLGLNRLEISDFSLYLCPS